MFNLFALQTVPVHEKLQLLKLLSLFAFLLSFLVVLVLTPLLAKLAFRFKLLDQPEARKVHKTPIPRLGGVGIYLGFLLGLGLFYWLSLSDKFREILPIKGQELLGIILIGTTLLFLLGLLDDLFKLGAWPKFIVQLGVSFLLISYGIRISFLNNPFEGIWFLPLWLSILLSMIWLSGVTNAMNLTDGLDGLLSGVVIISGSIFFLAAFFREQYFICMLIAPAIGACLGFLPYNYHPARIFMGDSGSLFLGILFGIISVIGALKSTATIALLIPLMILAYPILDTTVAIIRRIKNKKSPFAPDRGHLHHLLLKKGFPHPKAVNLLYIINLVLGVIALLLAVKGG